MTFGPLTSAQSFPGGGFGGTFVFQNGALTDWMLAFDPSNYTILSYNSLNPMPPNSPLAPSMNDDEVDYLPDGVYGSSWVFESRGGDGTFFDRARRRSTCPNSGNPSASQSGFCGTDRTQKKMHKRHPVKTVSAVLIALVIALGASGTAHADYT